MRVYSFNRTIYRGCVEREFYFFCLRRYPGLLHYLPGQIWATLRYWFGSLSRTGFWEAFHRYFQGIPEFQSCLAEFWTEQRLRKLKKLFLIRKREGDVILTGVPDCLLEPVQQRLGLRHLIASVVDPVSGSYTGLSCHGAEKLNRFRQSFPNEGIEEFWSAALTDEAVAFNAAQRKIVRGNRLLDWDEFEKKEGPRRKWLRTWISPEFFRFWCVGCVNMAVAWGLEAVWSIFLPPNPAFAVGYVLSLLVSFVLNSKVTFGAPLTFYRLGRFMLSYIPNFLVQLLSVFVFYNLLGWPHLLAYYLAAIVGTPVTFLCLKFFAFRGQGKVM